MAVTRRGAIQRMFSLSALYPLTAVASAIEPGTLDKTLQAFQRSEHDGNLSHAIALRAVRYLNTAEARYWQQTHRYATLHTLLRSETVRDLGPSSALIPPTSHSEGPIRSFTTALTLSDDDQRYHLIASELGSDFAYKSDESGVIFIGKLDGLVAPGTFTGAPIPELSRHRKPGPLGVIGAIASSFVPTLHACGGDPAECCGCCGGDCLGPGACGPVCGSGCCDIGGSTCTWCCVQSSCGCVNGCPL